MAKRPIVVSDEITEFLQDEINEMCSCMGCTREDRMVEIEQETAETLPLTDRIEERYTAFHADYYAVTVSE